MVSLPGCSSVSCFQRAGELAAILGPAGQRPHQVLNKVSRADQGVEARFKEKSLSSDKCIAMKQVQGQARSKYKLVSQR